MKLSLQEPKEWKLASNETQISQINPIISSNPILFVSRLSPRDTNNQGIFNCESGTLRLNPLLRLFQYHCLEFDILIHRHSARTDF